MKKKNVIPKNYLDQRPTHKEGIGWSSDKDGNITLEVENKGLANRIAQKILKKPKISYIHLDETGSFVWPLIDGVKTITEIGEYVEEHFGAKAYPLYERLAKYFQILDSYGFISWS